MGTRRSVSRRAGDLVRNSFFSGAVILSNFIDDFVKRLLYVDHMRYVWSMVIRGLSVKSV
jgi:hypothetical protein